MNNVQLSYRNQPGAGQALGAGLQELGLCPESNVESLKCFQEKTRVIEMVLP